MYSNTKSDLSLYQYEIHSTQQSIDSSEPQSSNQKNTYNHLHFNSPSNYVNLTAQQHFNNQTVNQHYLDGENNITFQAKDSEEGSPFKRTENSINTPGIQRQFTQIDQFLKETFDRHGIYEIVKNFVDMEGSLIALYEYNKRTLNKKYGQSQKKVRDFQISQTDENGLQSEQNIIIQFIHNLHTFLLSGNDDVQKQEQQLSNSKYISGQKKLSSQFITGSQNKQIYQSRSKNIIGQSILQPTGYNFSNEKMIQSISLNKKPITQEKCQKQTKNQMTQLSFVNTQGQQSLQSSIGPQKLNYHYRNANAQFMKTIHELRRQIRVLQEAKCQKCKDISKTSSIYLDAQVDQKILHNMCGSQTISNNIQYNYSQLKQKMNKEKTYKTKSQSIQNTIQVQRKQNSLKKANSVIKIPKDQQILKSQTTRLLILNNYQKLNDQNNPNLLNINQNYDLSNKKLSNIYLKQRQNVNEIKKTVLSQIIGSVDLSNCQNTSNNNLHSVSMSHCCNCVLNQLRILEFSKFILIMIQKFKNHFQSQIQIQIMLVKMILDKKIKSNFELRLKYCFEEVIDWCSKICVRETTKQKNLQQIMNICQDKKNQIVKQLRSMVEIH